MDRPAAAAPHGRPALLVEVEMIARRFADHGALAQAPQHHAAGDAQLLQRARPLAADGAGRAQPVDHAAFLRQEDSGDSAHKSMNEYRRTSRPARCPSRFLKVDFRWAAAPWAFSEA